MSKTTLPGIFEQQRSDVQCATTQTDQSLKAHIVVRCIDDHRSLVKRKPAFCICENKGADQLCGNREADQRLCFCYTGSTISLFMSSNLR